MERTPNGWKIIDAKIPVLMFTYSFGPGLANALAVGLKDGLAVISPPCRASSAVMDVLAACWRVTALVASNALHHLGLPDCTTRFPEAEVFAPNQSRARVEKKTNLTPVRSIS